ncbi:ARM repeat-containing protein [Anaeromyces robustus]|uniref:ARM repeat-containing protein n=1 Tax=Anaeromyces robustus TaxID=1754192 RepID=A0A1Y1X738_9FUNG|nr:ARM repeat-containing protein [Anaeromyces robustus]|eukprot:ORX81498.1 ARM repeat-containing protein [Anaeromyces robustus]
MITPSPNISSYDLLDTENTPIELITFKNQTAYGDRAIPKLTFELTSPDLQTRINALAFLAKILHKPENALYSLSYNIIDILLLIIKDDSDIEKELATRSVYIYTGIYISCHTIVNQNSFYILFEELNSNNKQIRKNIYEIFNRICSTDPEGVNLFLSMNYLPPLINKLKIEKYDLQYIILNLLYHCIKRGRPPHIPNQALECHSLEIFSQFLEPHIPAQLKIIAEKCIMALCVYHDSKVISCEIKIVQKLIKLLTNRKKEVRVNAVGALMNISIYDQAKKILSGTKAMTYLLNNLNDDHQDVILYSLKTLTNMSEDYTIRYQLLNNLDKFNVFLNHSNPNIIKSAKEAINCIKWKP